MCTTFVTIPSRPHPFADLFRWLDSELNLLLSTLTPEQRAQPAVEHALKVQTALATSNYHAFFVLFTQAPNMGAYMMDHFVERERVAALATMSKA